MNIRHVPLWRYSKACEYINELEITHGLFSGMRLELYILCWQLEVPTPQIIFQRTSSHRRYPRSRLVSAAKYQRMSWPPYQALSEMQWDEDKPLPSRQKACLPLIGASGPACVSANTAAGPSARPTTATCCILSGIGSWESLRLWKFPIILSPLPPMPLTSRLYLGWQSCCSFRFGEGGM